MNQFQETMKRFRPALAGHDYSSYWEWMLISNDLKAAALYVQFYDCITLAWSKTKKPFIEEETAVSTLMQYLIKNVPLIENDRKRFTENYLYKVAFNAFYPLGRIKRDIDYYYNERARPYQKINGASSDLEDSFDSDNPWYTENRYTDIFTYYDTYFQDERIGGIWKIIESCDDDTKRVVEYLLGGKKPGKRVSAKMPAVMAELQGKLKTYSMQV